MKPNLRSNWPKAAAAPAVPVSRAVVPAVPERVVERARLFDELDVGVKGPLTLVAGSPGAGKTVLLSAWVARRRPPGPVAWLSLERSDDDPRHFWAAVAEAFRQAGSADALASVSTSVAREGAGFDARLANAFGALERPHVLVLDDFHEVRDPLIHAQLDALMRHAPDPLRLVISTRRDPDLSLNRLRLEGRLTELRAAALAFTRDETSELFSALELPVRDEDLEVLWARTEGWVAGVRLAALSLDGHPDPHAFITELAGGERSVGGYLVEEVLAREPDDTRDFLLRTSVADRLNADLANALAHRADGGVQLEALERANAFVIPLDGNRTWFRYHKLFGELLRSELRHRMPDLFLVQHRKAARWHAAHGLDVEAVWHAMAGRDWALATRLFSEHWFTLLVRGDAAAIVEVARDLPERIVAEHAEVATALAGALLDLGELEEADRYIALAEAARGTVPPARRRGSELARMMLTLYRSRLRGDFAAALAAARELLGASEAGSEPSVTSHDRRAMALLHLGMAEQWSGDVEPAAAHLRDALALGRYAGRDYLVAGALSQLALLEAMGGRLRLAWSLSAEAADVAERHQWTGLPHFAGAHVARAMAAYFWGRLAEATRYADFAAASTRLSSERDLTLLVEEVRALVASAVDGPEEANRILRAARQRLDGAQLPKMFEIGFRWLEARSLAQAGEHEAAKLALDRAQPEGMRIADLDLVRAELALAAGDPEEALEVLGPAPGGVATPLHLGTEISVGALTAVSRYLIGDDEGAVETLEAALALAEADGYRQPFFELGAPLREPLSRLIRGGTAHRSLAGDLLDALDPESPSRPPGNALLLDPLSDREEAVLRYLPTVMSKAEIASEMFVSVNTVKTHVKNIYRKLDVTNRAEAVHRARTLRLL